MSSWITWLCTAVSIRMEGSTHEDVSKWFKLLPNSILKCFNLRILTDPYSLGPVFMPQPLWCQGHEMGQWNPTPQGIQRPACHSCKQNVWVGRLDQDQTFMIQWWYDDISWYTLHWYTALIWVILVCEAPGRKVGVHGVNRKAVIPCNWPVDRDIYIVIPAATRSTIATRQLAIKQYVWSKHVRLKHTLELQCT